MQRSLALVAGLGLLVAAAVVLGSPSATTIPAPEALGPRADWIVGPVVRARAPAGAGAPERPAVPVSVKPQGAAVWLDPTEITVAAFKSCVDAGACKPEQFTVVPGSPCNYDAPGRADHPMNCVDWNGAAAYCAWTEGRLCSEEEWFAGCRGPQGLDYPYGNAFVQGACNAVGHDVPAAQRGTTPVASLASCQGGYSGLYDMVGNVAEWLDACQGDYCHFYGGAFLDNDPLPDFASCKRFCAGNQKVFRSATIGFRCCHDSEPR